SSDIAGVAIRHPWLTILLWVVLLAAAVLSAGSLGSVLSDDNGVTGSAESARAQRLIDSRLYENEAPQEFVVIEAEGDVDRAQLDRLVGSLAAQVRQLPEVASVVSHLDGTPGLVTEDGRIALLQVSLAGAVEDSADLV